MSDGTLNHEDLCTSSSITENQCKLTVREKKPINLKGHPGHVFSIERKWHTKAGHHWCAKVIALIMVEMIQRKKESQRIGPSLPRHMLSDTAVVTGLVLVLALSYSRCLCALPKLLVASPMERNWVRFSNLADFYLNPHVLKTIYLQKLTSVSSLLTSIPLTIFGLLLHIYDPQQARRG